jgi:dihydroflavonol-4-reductase
LTTLVTGATGFLGRHLLPLLAGRGEELRALVREGTDADFLADLDVQVVRGDLVDPDAVRRAAAGCGRVFHLAGLLRYQASQKAALERANVGGVRTLLGGLEPGARLIHVSSVAAIGPVDSPAARADEDHPYPPRADRSLYSLTKRRGEELVLAAAREGVDAVVANPGFLIGPGDVYRVNTWPVQRYLQGTLRFLVDGGLSNVDPRDVAQGLVALAERGEAATRTILTAPDGNLSHEEFFRRVGEVTGVRRRQVVLPRKVALGAARVVPWPVRPEEVAAASDWWFFDPGKAIRELGFTTRPLDASIAETAAQYR